MLETLEMLCNLRGASGCEDEVRAYIHGESVRYAEKIITDSIGNLLVFVRGEQRRKSVLMLCAHMDEVGMIIREITEDGYLKFGFVGGVDRRIAIGKRVFVGNRAIPGVIGVKAIHLTTKKEREHAPGLNELYIDIGTRSASETEKLVSLGDFCTFDSVFRRIGNDCVKARAIDDRFGCALMLSLIRERLAYDTWFAFTVQEESGLRGARCATYTINPDAALIFDATTASDIPGVEQRDRVCALGEGAVISLIDGATMYNRKCFESLRSLAVKNNVKWQIKTRIAGATDAGAIHLSRAGVRCAGISLPTRYIHSPSSVARIGDMDMCRRLAALYIAREEI